MSSIGSRLKAERQRLGMSQAAFAAVGGVQKQAQLHYEKGERMPSADYLASVAASGVDVLYVVTGRRDASDLADDEAQMLDLFRKAPLVVRAAAVGTIQAGIASAQYHQNFAGANIGQQVSGDVTGPFSITVGGAVPKTKK